MHWLVNAAERAGWRASVAPTFAPGASLGTIWETVARSYGVSEDKLAENVATTFRLPRARTSIIEEKAVKLVPEKLARSHNVVPISERSNEIVVASSDPMDYGAEQAIGFASGRRVAMAVATPSEVQTAIDLYYSPERAMESLLQRAGASLLKEVQLLETETSNIGNTQEVESAPVIKLTNMILHAAASDGASDIHLEPGRAGGVVRFRIDGVLREYMPLPLSALMRVVSRIKVMGKLDIADRMRPQDGRSRVLIDGKAFDMRISTVPTREAEKAVIRLLNPDASRELKDVGLAPQELKRIEQLIGHREGIVIVTGPTGSGKTTTLYSAIRELARGAVNIMTVEDPVEYELAGVTQIQVETKRDVTFASALRAILRQDPDVVFVGEIRDLETAQVAVQASMTGHLVLATLHTNDAVGVVRRLLDLGLDRASVASALRGALGQRLLRRVCAACADRSGTGTAEHTRLEAKYGLAGTVSAVGCQACGGTGYKGRLPVVEVLVSNGEFQERVGRGASSLDLQRAAEKAGMRTLREVALERVSLGETTLEEIERVLGEAAAEPSAPPSAAPRVLFVDDDGVIRRIASSVLQKEGYETIVAENGAVALELLKTELGISLVVTDLNMPEMNGEELLKKIRSNVATAGLPVIVLTGSTHADAEVALINEGADDYIEKPLDPQRFVARVKAALRRAHT